MSNNKQSVAVGNSDVQMGEGVKFERIRRITGYLSTLPNFNDAKRAEEHDRIKHITTEEI